MTDLKAYLKSALENVQINSFDAWIHKAQRELKYNRSSYLCRLVLFVTAHDTIADEANHGLMKIGMPNTSPYLGVNKWTSEYLKSIEHVAAQKFGWFLGFRIIW